MQRVASVLIIFPFVLALALPLSASAVDCSGVPGTHPAAADEVPGVAAGTCVPAGGGTQSNLLNGGCDFNPYPVLEGYKTGGNVLVTPSNSGDSLRDGINPALACRLAQFLQDAQKTRGCRFAINSGYRSSETQASTCKGICGNSQGCHKSQGDSADCGRPGGSCHQYGLAVDITGPQQCMAWAHSFLGVGSASGQGAQQFKIFFPISSDTVHVQCIENPIGGCSTNTKPCDGSVKITPNLATMTGSQMPFDQQARQALGMQQPPPPPPPPQQQAPAATPAATTPAATNPTTPPAIGSGVNTTPFPAGTCAPQTYCSQDDGNIYYRATTCVDQVNKKCPSGCTGLICNATSTASNTNPFLSDFFSTNTGDGSSNGSNGTSTFDLIDFFANPTGVSTAVGTATPIDVNETIQNTGNAEILGAVPPPGTLNGVGATGQAGGLSQQQTFTSGDLSNSPASFSSQSSSTFQQTLVQMKAVLLAMLPYVTPFGGRIGTQTVVLE